MEIENEMSAAKFPPKQNFSSVAKNEISENMWLCKKKNM